MSRVLAVLIGVLALASVWVWLTTSRPTRPEAAVASATGPEEPAMALAQPATRAGPSTAATDPAHPDLFATDRVREAAPTDMDAELARTQRSDGAVLEHEPLPASGLTLAGRVTDERGVALAAFELSAWRIERGRTVIPFAGDLTQPYRDTDGSFRMAGFSPGEWELRARSEGHAGSEPLCVTVPPSGPVALILPREALVSGQVVDPSGVPVLEAKVKATGERQSLMDACLDLGFVAVGAQGTFEIRGLGPGSTQLVAHGRGFAPSEPRLIELSAGDLASDLVLQLRHGGTILGDVRGSEGHPLSGLRVHVGVLATLDLPVFTAADGCFRVVDLPPGELALSASLPEGIEVSQRVRVAAGEITRVRLAPPSAIVRLHGRALAGDEPLSGARLRARRIDERHEPDGSSSFAKTDAEGAYELNLPGPGCYGLTLFFGSSKDSLAWSSSIDVPPVDALAKDVFVPVGRISGRVTDSAGTPLRGVEVESEPERHEGAAHGSSRARTDEEGCYELLVPEGRHAVKAGGDPGPWPETSGRPYAEARVGGLVVRPSSRLDRVDLQLALGGILVGSVKDSAGSPVPFAQLWSLDQTQFVRLGRCDGTGRFHLRGVSAETRFVGATSEAGTTREPVQVQVAAGETQRLALELVPATLVHFTVKKNGVLVGSDLTVHDERGRIQPVRSGTNGEAWLGPVIAGRYTVRARRDIDSVERVLDVTGVEEPLEIELVFE